MEVKVFQKTQRELASTINLLIDRYWNDEIDELHMVQSIKNLYLNNENKFIKNNQFTTVLRQQCGKRRLEVVSKILKV
ncbi:TIGR04540 family protein [Radiobacillus sp. PE A8.2]|uniref:TIGR04540 family protein n=1 Tax=Radiobacillus sp. PE A8.2 TaxID=3380349 RepID=UPI00388EE446